MVHMEYFSAIKKRELESSVGKWMRLEIMLGNINQTHRLKYCMVPLT